MRCLISEFALEKMTETRRGTNTHQVQKARLHDSKLVEVQQHPLMDVPMDVPMDDPMSSTSLIHKNNRQLMCWQIQKTTLRNTSHL